MTEKVLPGSSREALGFIKAHWQSLLKMSLLPYVAYLVVTVLQLRSMSSLYRTLGTMTNGQDINPNFMGAYMQGMALSMLGSLLAMCLFGLLFAQIIRFHRSGVASWLMTDGAGIKAGLMTLVYGIGITMLTLLAYLGGVLAFALVAVVLGLIFSAILGSSAAAGVVMAVLVILGIVSLLAGLCWFMCRFLVGLPGVALGSSPDFFKDMWPLSRGESWGLPLRLLLATLIAYVPIIAVFALFMGPQWLEMMEKLTLPENANNPAVTFPLMADMLDHMLPATATMMVLYMPFMWFMSLLLAIAFQRFRARDRAPVR
jgi:hypothetical protein